MKKIGKILMVLLALVLMTGCGGEEKKQVVEQTGGETNVESTVISGNTTEESVEVTKEKESVGETKEESTEIKESVGESEEEVEYTGEPAFPDGKVYVNEEYRYAVTVPKGWDVDEKTLSLVSFSTNPEQEGTSTLQIFIFADRNTEKLSITEWHEKNPEVPFPSYKTRTLQLIKFKKQDALKDNLRGDILFSRGTDIYYIQNGYLSKGDVYPEEREIFEKSLNSLVLY